MMNLHPSYEGLPIAVIIEGRIQKKNLSLIEKDEQWLVQQLKERGFTHVDHIFYAAVRDTDHSLTIDNGEGEANRL
jgi:uncharacterized membrane protein YcaP (DUF421 family)